MKAAQRVEGEQELRVSPVAVGSKTGVDRQQQNEAADDVLQIELSRELALMRNRNNGTKQQATFCQQGLGESPICPGFNGGRPCFGRCTRYVRYNVQSGGGKGNVNSNIVPYIPDMKPGRGIGHGGDRAGSIYDKEETRSRRDAFRVNQIYKFLKEMENARLTAGRSFERTATGWCGQTAWERTSGSGSGWGGIENCVIRSR